MPARKTSAAATNSGKHALFNASMAAEEARRATFALTSPRTWPHPTKASSKESSSSASASKSSTPSNALPTPEALARAGFYFDPESANNKHADLCVHYICGTQVSGWNAGDQPLERLREENPQCSSVLLKDSLDAQQERDAWFKLVRKGKEADAVWEDAQLLPTSDEMIEARLATFGTNWPYDKKKGWSPTSAKLAAAGFFFDPTEDSPDNGTCVYCSRTLGGWEKADDPMEEHRRRTTKEDPCPFFSCTLVSVKKDQVEVEETVPSKRQGKVTRRKAQEKEDADTVAIEVVSDDSEVEEVPAPPARTRSARSTTTSTRKASTRRAKSAAKDVPEEEDQGTTGEKQNTQEENEAEVEEQAEIEEQPKRTKKPKASSRAASRARGKAKVDDEPGHQQEEKTTKEAEEAAQAQPEVGSRSEEKDDSAISSSKGSSVEKRLPSTGRARSTAAAPVRASSRSAARAASESIRAKLEEERIGAITRPKYPEQSQRSEPEKPKEAAEPEATDAPEEAEATTIEHEEEGEDVDVSEAEPQEPAVQQKVRNGKGAQIERKASLKSTRAEMTDAEEDVRNTEKDQSEARSSSSLRSARSRTASSRSTSKSTTRKGDSSETKAKSSDDTSADEAASSAEAMEKQQAPRTRKASGKSKTGKGQGASESNELSASKPTKAAQSNAILSDPTAPLGESSVINTEPPKVSTPPRKQGGSSAKVSAMLQQLEQLGVGEHQKHMTVQQYLEDLGRKQVEQMEAEGLRKILAAEEHLKKTRARMEAMLRG